MKLELSRVWEGATRFAGKVRAKSLGKWLQLPLSNFVKGVLRPIAAE